MDCFYEKGLDFQCKGCNYCCSSEPGYVFLSEEDIQKLSKGTGLERQVFLDTYCRKIDMGSFYMVSLIEKENYDCIFLSAKGCKVYQSRPRQCMTYPFWAHVLEDENSWNEEKKACPGIGKGRHYSKEEIYGFLEYRLENNPLIIFK